jgi:hypothetical protein
MSPSEEYAKGVEDGKQQAEMAYSLQSVAKTRGVALTGKSNEENLDLVLASAGFDTKKELAYKYAALDLLSSVKIADPSQNPAKVAQAQPEPSPKSDGRIKISLIKKAGAK